MNLLHRTHPHIAQWLRQAQPPPRRDFQHIYCFSMRDVSFNNISTGDRR